MKRTHLIENLQKQINDLNRQRKHYRLQSEWHRMMHDLTLKLETLQSIEDGSI